MDLRYRQTEPVVPRPERPYIWSTGVVPSREVQMASNRASLCRAGQLWPPHFLVDVGTDRMVCGTTAERSRRGGAGERPADQRQQGTNRHQT